MMRLYSCIFLTLYTIVTILSDNVVATRGIGKPKGGVWWYLGVTNAYRNPARDRRAKDNTARCNIPYLNKKQRQLCYKDADLLGIISDGAARGIEECQSQFLERHWNCTIFNTTNVFGRVAKLKSRETAFIYAIQSAGMMYALTRSCAKGELRDCSCDPNIEYVRKTSNFQWGGCSENIAFGHKFAQKFVDAMENKQRPSGHMNLWNNEAGRKAIKSNMKLLCKCHGVSGSCSIKVCWRIMDSFKKIGTNLKDRYDGATMVKLSRKKKILKAKNNRLKPPTKTDLVYLVDSPSFCEKNKQSGAVGTTGRLCNMTSAGLDSCTILCCGRGYDSYIKDVVEECKCEFIWCCDVRCQKCRFKVEQQFCK
uniref:Protein Wnt n=1 Tax=Terebratalia transversa TaxID=34513 RepID=A0AAU7EAU8_TERTR